MSRQTSRNPKQQASLDRLADLAHNHCKMCAGRIRVMCFKGTGVCSEICRKRRDGETIGALESRTAG